VAIEAEDVRPDMAADAAAAEAVVGLVGVEGIRSELKVVVGLGIRSEPRVTSDLRTVTSSLLSSPG
jgi:hypothetical protein